MCVICILCVCFNHRCYILCGCGFGGTKLQNIKFVLYKNLTGHLVYVNATSFTLKHSYTFQPSRGHPRGVLIHFMSQVNKILVQMQLSATYLIIHCSLIWYLHLAIYLVDLAHEMYQYSLRMAPWGLKRVGVFQCEWSGVNIYKCISQIFM